MSVSDEREAKPAFGLAVKGTEKIIGERFDATSEGVAGWNELIEVDDVKKQLQRLGLHRDYNATAAQALGFGIKQPRFSAGNNILIVGPSGVCKTTLGRRIALDLAETHFPNFKPSGIFVSATDLVCEHLGEAQTYTGKLIDKCDKDILLIDEIDQLLDGHFGLQVLKTLNAKLGLGRAYPIVIATMNETNLESFGRADNGLRSRFPNILHRPAYSDITLTNLFENLVSDYGAKCDHGVAKEVQQLVRQQRSLSGTSFGNGRFIENLWRAMKTQREAELESKYSAKDIHSMTDEDKEKLKKTFSVVGVHEIPEIHQGEYFFAVQAPMRDEKVGSHIVQFHTSSKLQEKKP